MTQLTRLSAITLLCVGLLPARAAAQEQGGELIQGIAWDINPADAAKWVQGVEQIVAAAKQAKLAQNYGWFFWQDDIFRYRLIFPVQNMAYFDDPMQWMRKFEGTPGQATLMKAFELLNTVAATTVEDIVVEQVPAWSRDAALDLAMFPHAHVDQFWLKGGMEAQLDALMKEVVAFLGEIGYRYPMAAYRPRLGGTGQHFIVTFFDSRANFYGVNDLERLIQQKNQQAKWGALLGRFSSLMTRATHYDSDYRANLSYMPAPQASGNGGR